MIITPEQCRAARAMLGWGRDQLSQAASVAPRTLVDFERGARQPYGRTLIDIKTALERAGIIFLDGNGDGPGVRLKKQRKRDR
jgi:DNA-binding XRE family transcriptional regulator